MPGTPLIAARLATANERHILTRRRNDLVGVTDVLEQSADLIHWQPAAAATVVATSDNGDGSSTLDWLVPSDADPVFYRVSFTLP